MSDRPDINGEKTAEDSQAELAWWDEERDRANQLADYCRENGLAAKSQLGPPPELNEDGSLKDSGRDTGE